MQIDYMQNLMLLYELILQLRCLHPETTPPAVSDCVPSYAASLLLYGNPSSCKYPND